MTPPPSHWRLCSSCREPIPFRTPYWVCSVSTCTQKRTGLTFCSVSCWEAHLPTMRHREAWAVEMRSPTPEEAERERLEPADDEPAPRRVVAPSAAPASAPRIAATAPAPAAPSRPVADRMAGQEQDELPRDVLIVTSKLKRYIRARSGMNTSDSVIDALSDIVRTLCDAAIRQAAQDGRKTVMDRDFRR
jgi:hypothetical protein